MGGSAPPSSFLPLLLTEPRGLGQTREEFEEGAHDLVSLWLAVETPFTASLHQGLSCGLGVVPPRLLWDRLHPSSPSQGRRIMWLPSDGLHQLLSQGIAPPRSPWASLCPGRSWVHSSLALVESTRLTSSLTSVPPQTTQHSLTHSCPGQLQPWFFASSRLLPRVRLSVIALKTPGDTSTASPKAHPAPRKQQSQQCPPLRSIGPKSDMTVFPPCRAPALLWFPWTPASG